MWLAFCLAGVLVGTANAVPEEIQIYMDELLPPHQMALDIHQNWTPSGRIFKEWPGAEPSAHRYRFTPELYYGICPNLEVGLHFLTTTDYRHHSYFDGYILRFKYIAPHNPEHGFFWGANAEVGLTSRRISEDRWNGELKGIYGYRGKHWVLAVNPNLEINLSRTSHPYPGISVNSRIGYELPYGWSVGVENYNGLGDVHHFGNVKDNEQLVFLAVDKKYRQCVLNIGIGKGYTSPSDRWIIKGIIGFPLGVFPKPARHHLAHHFAAQCIINSGAVNPLRQ